MVEKRNCSFCGNAIEPGTGKMYIRKDGTVYNFCCNKCKKNSVDLGRVSRRTRWTTRYAELKASSLKREKAAEGASEEAPEEKPNTKPKKKPVPRESRKPAPAKESGPVKKPVPAKKPAEDDKNPKAVAQPDKAK